MFNSYKVSCESRRHPIEIFRTYDLREHEAILLLRAGFKLQLTDADVLPDGKQPRANDTQELSSAVAAVLAPGR